LLNLVARSTRPARQQTTIACKITQVNITLLGPTASSFQPWIIKYANTIELKHNLKSPDAAVFADLDHKSLRDLRNLPRDTPKVLVRFEPKVVMPRNYSLKSLEDMQLVIDVGRPFAQEKSALNWPQTWDLSRLENAVDAQGSRISRFALINANKLSFINGELYSLRRQVIQTSPLIDTWGIGWEASVFQKTLKAGKEAALGLSYSYGLSLDPLRGWFAQPKNLSGPTGEKLDTLSKYNWSLVVENSLDVMTEKLFDCLFAGSFPVYVGPKIDQFGIPKFVALQAEPSPASVLNAMEVAMEVDLIAWRRKTLDWLKSDSVEIQWSSSKVMSTLVSRLEVALNGLTRKAG